MVTFEIAGGRHNEVRGSSRARSAPSVARTPNHASTRDVARDDSVGAGHPAVRSTTRAAHLVVVARLDRLRAGRYLPTTEDFIESLADGGILSDVGPEVLKACDVVAVATPNPRDPSLSFLVLGHHLEDAVFRKLLAGAPAMRPPMVDFPEPGVVVFAPIALGARRSGIQPTVDAATRGGVVRGGSAVRDPPEDFRTIIAGLAAVVADPPTDGPLWVEAAALLRTRGRSGTGSRPVSDLDAPVSMTARVVSGESYSLELVATFEEAQVARRWQAVWPRIEGARDDLLARWPGGTPSGLTHGQLVRDGSALRLRIPVTAAELSETIRAVLRIDAALETPIQ